MPKKDVSVVSVIVGEDIKDPDLKAIYLINEALELSTPRMVRSNLEFVFASKRWSKKYNLKLNRVAPVPAVLKAIGKSVVMQVPQFEELLQVRLAELPYTKHLDDGQYNDGQAYGFECGARWAYEKLSSGTT